MARPAAAPLRMASSSSPHRCLAANVARHPSAVGRRRPSWRRLQLAPLRLRGHAARSGRTATRPVIYACRSTRRSSAPMGPCGGGLLLPPPVSCNVAAPPWDTLTGRGAERASELRREGLAGARSPDALLLPPSRARFPAGGAWRSAAGRRWEEPRRRQHLRLGRTDGGLGSAAPHPPAAYLDDARGSLPTKPPTAAPTVASRRGGPSAVNLRHINVHVGVSCQHKWTSVTHFESSWTLLRPGWTLVRPEQCLGTGMTHFLS
jgi:hypothetical protein